MDVRFETKHGNKAGKHEWIPEQYTGQNDLDGRESYECDIIEFYNAPGMEDGTAAIVWNNNSCAWYIENDNQDIWEPLYNVTGYFRVIGNTHQNSNYLE